MKKGKYRIQRIIYSNSKNKNNYILLITRKFLFTFNLLIILKHFKHFFALKILVINKIIHDIFNKMKNFIYKLSRMLDLF